MPHNISLVECLADPLAGPVDQLFYASFRVTERSVVRHPQGSRDPQLQLNLTDAIIPPTVE